MSYLAKNYNRKKISFVRGKGSYLYSTSGKKYLDFVQGIAVNSLGHAHPKLVKTIRDQSKKLWHVSNAFQIPEGEKLAKKLCQKTFADYVMFQNSGAEATEAAIKVARRYFYSIGKPYKNRVLCVKNAFRRILNNHSLTMKKIIVTTLAFAGLAFHATAEGLNAKQVPASAQWVIHMDFDGFKTRELGKFAMNQMDEHAGDIDALSVMLKFVSLGTYPNKSTPLFTVS